MMDQQVGRTQQPHWVKFNWELSVGTILTIISVVGVGIGVYTTLKEDIAVLRAGQISFEGRVDRLELKADPGLQLQDHEVRIRQIEQLAVQSRAERLSFQKDVMEILTSIREDVASLKASRTGGGN